VLILPVLILPVLILPVLNRAVLILAGVSQSRPSRAGR
jgi:ABC-type transport system involved in cytochrome c biogenesis permease component